MVKSYKQTFHAPNEASRPLFVSSFLLGISPQRVSEAIETAINSTEPKLRFPIEGGANVLIEGQSKMSDEEWIAMGRHESVEDYFQEFAMRLNCKAMLSAY